MNTLQKLNIALQTVNNLEGLRRDIFQNLTSYADMLTAGVDASSVATVMKQDAAQYRRRIDWQAPYLTDASLKADYSAGLAAVNLTTDEVQNICSELMNAVTAVESSTLATQNEIAAVIASIRSGITSYKSLYS